jgi:hypothetical protein
LAVETCTVLEPTHDTRLTTHDWPRVERAATRQALPLLLLGLLATIAMLVLILVVAVLGGADAQTEATIALTFAGLLVIASGMYVVVSRRPRVAWPDGAAGAV